ncbi:ATP-dependent DNA helicase [Microbacterium karelineae]|uniref:ATP-dependent DNA helicase n=1 Tax=Microbacterium karelineae TaxID=2654283 RepID=UPI0012E9D245|nr:ATP-dependent DNA helicase [Microbacterium karelineae]
MTRTTPLDLSADLISRALGLFAPTRAQRAVIEAPPEPALVVAGAGSGKTETMSARVVWLVANGHVRADEILGLTFTRKAAGELAERIARRLDEIDEFDRRGLLPHLPEIVESREFARIADAAAPAQRAAVRREVLDGFASRFGTDSRASEADDRLLNRPRVSTYNAFADSVVRENAARIGRDPDAGMLSGSSAWVVARRVAIAADGVGLEDLDSGLGEIVRAIQNLAGALLDNRTAPDAVRRYAAAQAAAFAAFVDPTVSSTRPWESAHAALKALPVLLDLVAEYDAEKQRRGVLDFADQVSGALDVVEAAPDVADALRAQHRVVLLDEYQDTSVLQTRLLSALFRDTAVMAVGDPNQAIYGWRGASADNIHAFAHDFARAAPTHSFDLMTSWRNDRVVLRAANRLVRPFARPDRPAVHELEPRPGAGEGRLDVVFAETVDEEAERVADWFVERRREHIVEHAAGAPHTGAILFRSKKHMQRFADALAAQGVPHRILGLGGLLAVPEVTDLVSALRVLHDPSEGSSLIRLLVGPRFAVGLADMGALHDLASELSRRDESLAPLPDDVRQRVRESAGIDEQVSIIDALDFVRTAREGYRLLGAFSDEGRARLREAAEMFDRLRRAAGQPIPDLLRMIEQELRLDIELAANETRGSARTASAQLRAFADEVRGFLAVDERGTIGSVLAWLDHAEQADDLMPHTEPPEPGVVQLLTIHGSKGLEWDAVAVVRLVEGELPGSPKNVMGGFAFGHLPYVFRGDAAALPRFEWQAPAISLDGAEKKAAEKELRRAFDEFKSAGRAHQGDEERRLAYVAVTRARGDLLLTGSHWAGQSKPRRPSVFLDEILDELAREPIEPVGDEAENPYAGHATTLEWPLDALGARRSRVAEAAGLVRAAGSTEPTPELARLLAEREEVARGVSAAVPTRVPASKFKDYVVGFYDALGDLVRPMPERPYRQTRLGTLFHQWVEKRSGVSGPAVSVDDALWDVDDEGEWSGTAVASAEDERDLARLRAIFERGEWAALRPIEVETEVDFALELDAGDPHIMICKLDAVYRRGDRIEIVDWKTGKAPSTAKEREERMLQLALYRLAYHRRHGVPLDEIDVALYYVPDDLVLRDDRPMGEAELIERWRAARQG